MFAESPLPPPSFSANAIFASTPIVAKKTQFHLGKPTATAKFRADFSQRL